MEVVAPLVADLVIFAALYVAIGREDATREKTATPEMWERRLAFYQAKAGHGVKTVTRERSSLRDCAASASNHMRTAGK